jgi:hypothetical protein
VAQEWGLWSDEKLAVSSAEQSVSLLAAMMAVTAVQLVGSLAVLMVY